jgi:hypothetical protein
LVFFIILKGRWTCHSQNAIKKIKRGRWGTPSS